LLIGLDDRQAARAKRSFSAYRTAQIPGTTSIVKKLKVKYFFLFLTEGDEFELIA
jgi:hypothetical protein